VVDEARPLDGGLRWKVSRGEIRGRCGCVLANKRRCFTQ
jgi:hypothetical protein